MFNPTTNWLRKLIVPIIAIVIVLALIVYSAGFDNVLKFLASRAGTVGTIELTSQAQLLGNDPSTPWLVAGSQSLQDGVSVFASFSGIPLDSGEIGFVAPIYSSANIQENIFQTHTYITPVIDLGAAATIGSISATYHTPESNVLRHGYRVADSVEGISAAAFVPLELAETAESTDPDITTATQLLEIAAPRYLQLRVEFVGDTFASRSAVYGWTIQTDSAATEDEVEDLAVAVQAPQTRSIMLVADDLTTLPLPLELKIVSALDFGQMPIVTETIASMPEEGLLLEVELASGAYGLAVSSPGFIAQLIPFEIEPTDSTVSLQLGAFEPDATLEPSFDLNADGTINSLDLTLLLQEIGMQ